MDAETGEPSTSSNFKLTLDSESGIYYSAKVRQSYFKKIIRTMFLTNYFLHLLDNIRMLSRNVTDVYKRQMADETVFAAENYSEKIAIKIRTIEFLSALDMLCLVILIIMQTLTRCV